MPDLQSYYICYVFIRVFDFICFYVINVGRVLLDVCLIFFCIIKHCKVKFLHQKPILMRIAVAAVVAAAVAVTQFLFYKKLYKYVV